MDAKAQRILNIYEAGVSETELTETLKTKINASTGGSLGSIKPTDAAPTPARNGNYTFSIGGNKPAWLTAEAGVTEVKAGDGVAVVYTAPSSYTYTHVDMGSEVGIIKEILLNDILIEPANKMNPVHFKSGGYIDNASGKFVTYVTSYFCTGFQKVQEGLEYVLWNNNINDAMYNVLHYYGEGGNGQNYLGNNATLGGVYLGGAWYFTAPVGCAYIACNADISSLSQTFEQFKGTAILEIGRVKTTYSSYFEPYYVKKFKENENIPTAKKDIAAIESIIGNKAITIFKTGNYIYIRTKFNSTKDLVQKILFENADTKNADVKFYGTWLIENTNLNTLSEIESGTFIHWTNDDVSPSQINNTYIGATHGSYDVLSVSASAHGKTVVDVGSEWIDSLSNKFYIIKIIDANTLWVLSKNQSVTDKWSFLHSINGNLSHSTNATHTSPITVSSYALTQLLPATKNQVKTLYLDEVEILIDGVYSAKSVVILNKYDIVNPANALTSIIAAVGSSVQPPLNNGDAVINNSISYSFDSSGGCVIQNAWRNLQDVNLNIVGFIQRYPLDNTVYPQTYLHIPKALPIVAGARTFDFRGVERYDAQYAPTDIINFTLPYWENQIAPPDRTIDFLADSSGVKKIAFAMGYDLVSGLGKNRKDLVLNALNLYTTRKIYPHGIDNKLNNPSTFFANNWYECVSYRKYLDCESFVSNNFYSFSYKLGNETRMYFGYLEGATVLFDSIACDLSLIGHQIELVEKSSNITIHNDVVLENGIVISKSDTAYSYVCINIK